MLSNFSIENPYQETIKNVKNEKKVKEETLILKEISLKSTFKYKINLVCDLPLQIYKDKPFKYHVSNKSLLLNIVLFFLKYEFYIIFLLSFTTLIFI